MTIPANAMTGSVELLRTEGLTKSFGGIRAVDQLNLSLTRGELRCLIGPNGAGKSTLFGLLSGLNRPEAGKIMFKGEDITKLKAFQRVRKGLCQKFQTTRIYRAFSVAQNLAIAGGVSRSRKSNNDTLQWALDTLGLESEGEMPGGELSHSHQQWLEICLALATEPDLLLLDEPTAGMTPEETELTAKFIVSLNCQGLTVLVVEHDMAFVRYIAQRITVLHYGRVFTEGSLEEIESNHEVRRIYLGER